MTAPGSAPLAHVRCIGGGTDAGKTSVARLLSERLRWPVHHYDAAEARHAVFLVPSAGFRQAAMQARGEDALGRAVSDPAKAALNLLDRDRRVADRIRAQAQAHGLTVIEVDGAQDAQALATRLAALFQGAETGLPSA